MKKKNRSNERLEEITASTLIVGVDIAKTTHWARFIDCRGIEIGKAISFKSNRQGFESIVAKIESIRNNKAQIYGKSHKKTCKQEIKWQNAAQANKQNANITQTDKQGAKGQNPVPTREQEPKTLKPAQQRFDKVLIGMEPTGHYWKTFAHYLANDGFNEGYKIVCVNPYHTKKAKELDDNSQNKSDYKDAITIAKLVKDGRFFNPYLPQDDYAELRVLANTRLNLMKRLTSAKNIIIAVLDEYFPELSAVWKDPLKGKASRQILKSCPFPSLILKLGEDGVLAEIKKAVKRTVGRQKARQLIETAQTSVGVNYGIESSKLRLNVLLNELDLIERDISQVEASMERFLYETGYAEQILSIKGIGVVTAASFLGETGDPLRFQNARQIANYAGFNLTEDSSGKSKSGTRISKRGRSDLRSLLYQMAFTMVGQNTEMKALHKYLTTRTKNPLKKKQSLVAVSKKIITVIYSLLKKQATYDPELALGVIRREMINAA